MKSITDRSSSMISKGRRCGAGLLMLSPCCCHQVVARFGSHGQPHCERCARPIFVVGAEYFALMLTHDSITNAQAQTGSLPNFFGGEKRIEDALRKLDALAVISE